MLRASGIRFAAVVLPCTVLVLALFLSGCPATVPSTVAPDASFVGKPATGTPPLKVQFNDTSKPGTSDIVSWYWEFGDGAVSAERNPSHTYYEAGTYTVSLTVTSVVSPASKTVSVGYVRVREATTMERIGTGGGTIQASGAQLAVPQGALASPVIFGLADGDGSMPVDGASGEVLVSDVFSLAHDQSDFFVDARTPMSLEIPFAATMVPEADRNGSKLQILAHLETGVTIPILGEVYGDSLVAPIAGLPHRASYAVVYRPALVTEDISVDDFVAKSASPTGYAWNTNAWRVTYTLSELQALTALRIGTLGYPYPYDQRAFSTADNEDTLADLRNAVSEMHNLSQLAGFISPALIASTGNAFTLILYHMNEPPVTDYIRASDVTFAASPFGSIVVDPAQLIAITKRNPQAQAGEPTGIEVDRMQELDFSNAFGQEFFHSIFRGYAYPEYTTQSVVDLDADENQRSVPYFLGFENGLATFMGQIASAYHTSRVTSSDDAVLMARSLGLNEYSTFWEPLFAPFSHTMPGYSYASQDFFFYLGLRFPDTIPGTPIPKVLLFVADSYEGVLELMRVREAMPTVTDYTSAQSAAYVATDLALQKNFGQPLAQLYWDYAKGRAYENGDANTIRPTDAARKDFTLSEDRFNSQTLVSYTFTKMNTPVTISYDTNPAALLDIPPLSTRAIALSATGVAGDLSLYVNTFDWVPDAAGNSMKVKVYKEGIEGEELNANQAQATLKGLGETTGFKRAIILISNVTADRYYSASVIASVKAGTSTELTGVLGGQVTDAATGDALQSVDVVAHKMVGTTVGSQVGATTTDSRGIFIFLELPSGDVELTFSKSGYVTQKLTRTVTAGETAIVRVSMSQSK